MPDEGFQNLLSREKNQDNFQGESRNLIGTGGRCKTRADLALPGEIVRRNKLGISHWGLVPVASVSFEAESLN